MNREDACGTCARPRSAAKQSPACQSCPWKIGRRRPLRAPPIRARQSTGTRSASGCPGSPRCSRCRCRRGRRAAGNRRASRARLARAAPRADRASNQRSATNPRTRSGAPVPPSTPRYRGVNTVTSWPRRPSAAGERCRDVGQPSGLRERLRFRSDHHDAKGVGGAGGHRRLRGHADYSTADERRACSAYAWITTGSSRTQKRPWESQGRFIHNGVKARTTSARRTSPGAPA